MSGRKQPRNGKLASTPVAPPLAGDNGQATAELKRILAKVYDAYQKLQDPVLNRECRRDFVFHMTDWLADLRRLSELYDHPQAVKKQEADQIVFEFLIHAVPHLMAAGRLLLGHDIEHPFDYPWQGRDGSP